MERIICNIGSSPTRKEVFEGRNYIVAPAVMAAEGVINGSQGPLYYPKEDLSKTPVIWNHKPIVIDHPMKDGKGISACDPVIMESRKVGMLLNTIWDGKLKTECWFEEEKTKKVEPRILEALEKNQKMEVSTGLFTDNEVKEGEFNGVKYTAIVRNIRPDHLAILPNTIGAFSIAMGGGLLANEEGKPVIKQEEIRDIFQAIRASKLLMANAMGTITLNHGLNYRDIYSQLNKAHESGNNVMGSKNYGWVEDIYTDSYVYYENGSYYKDGYSVKSDMAVQPEGKPAEVKKHSEYRTLDGKTAGTISVMNEKGNTVADNVVPPVVTPPVITPPVVNKPMTLQEYINNAPPEIRCFLEEGIAMAAAEKEKLIGVITSNAANIFTKEALAVKQPGELRAIAALAQVAAPARTPIYNGAGGVPPVNNTMSGNTAPQAPLSIPVMNFAKK